MTERILKKLRQQESFRIFGYLICKHSYEKSKRAFCNRLIVPNFYQY